MFSSVEIVEEVNTYSNFDYLSWVKAQITSVSLIYYLSKIQKKLETDCQSMLSGVHFLGSSTCHFCTPTHFNKCIIDLRY